MDSERIETGKAPHLTITKCLGKCTIGGWKRSAVDLSGADVTARVPEFDHIVAESSSDLALRVPAGTTLVLEKMASEVIVKHVDGHIALSEVGGDVTLGNTGSIIIHRAGAAIVGENINGPIAVLEVKGALKLRGVADLQVVKAGAAVTVNYARGSVSLEEVNGPLVMHTVSGAVTVNRSESSVMLSNLGGITKLLACSGVIRLEGGLSSGEHSLRGEEDILVRWPVDAPLTLSAGGRLVRSSLLLENLIEAEADGRMTVTGHIDDGKTLLALSSEKNVAIMPVHSVGGEAPEEADFDYDFSQPSPAPAAEPVTTSGAQAVGRSKLQEEITASLVSGMQELGVAIEPDKLAQLVAVAFASVSTQRAEEAGSALQDNSALAGDSTGLRYAEQAKQAVERSLQDAQESMDRARAKVQPAKEQAGPKPETAGEKTEAPVQTAPEAESPPNVAPPHASPEKVASEEQMHILKLLKDGHITVQQADTLLQAINP
jgi:hypothetical protein